MKCAIFILLDHVLKYHTLAYRMLFPILTGRTKDKESLQDYKARQKEMFRVQVGLRRTSIILSLWKNLLPFTVTWVLSLLQYAVAVKKESIRKLKRDSEQALRKIKQEEEDLEKDAMAFEQFVKQNDQSSVEAIKLSVVLLLFHHSITIFKVISFLPIQYFLKLSPVLSRAEKETLAKLELTAKIKKVTSEIMTVKRYVHK